MNTAMSSEQITKYLQFPFQSFLMVRYEYTVICGNELEAKVLRIIEDAIDRKRFDLYSESVATHGVPDEPLDIRRDIWVPISYKVFTHRLYGMVSSENTLKRTLASLIEKRLILRRFAPEHQYDAPEYTINYGALQVLLHLAGEDQKLIPSAIDTLKKTNRGFLSLSGAQKLIPSGGQNLIPSPPDTSSAQKLRVSKIDPLYYRDSNNKKIDNKYIYASDDAYTLLEEQQHTIARLQDEIKMLREQLFTRAVEKDLSPVDILPMTTSSVIQDDNTSPQVPLQAEEAGGYSQPKREQTFITPPVNAPDPGGVEQNAVSAFFDPTDQNNQKSQDDTLLRIAETTTRKTVSRRSSKHTHEQPEQTLLLDVLPPEPVMPPDSMPWCAEKLVQITEAKRYVRGKQSARFLETLPRDGEGKKGKRASHTQRQRQIEAARTILEQGITQERYILAYDQRNDEWWNDTQGSLSVEDMAKTTTRGMMRILEVLEKCDSISSKCGKTRLHLVPVQEEVVVPQTYMAAGLLRSAQDRIDGKTYEPDEMTGAEEAAWIAIAEQRRREKLARERAAL